MRISELNSVQSLLGDLKGASKNTSFKVEGAWGAFAPALAAMLTKELKRPLLYISSSIDSADTATDDLALFAGYNVQTLPAWEAEPDLTDASDEIGTERLRLSVGVSSLAQSDLKDELIISSSIQAICQPVPKPESLKDESLSLAVNQAIEPGLILAWLNDAGFESVDRIDMAGQFASRGGIIDVFASMAIDDQKKGCLSRPARDFTKAIRIEFFDDLIESIRLIDLDTQRSYEEVERVTIFSAVQYKSSKQSQNFLELLPEDTLIFLEEPSSIQEIAELYLSRLESSAGMYDWQSIERRFNSFTRLEISRFADSSQTENYQVDVRSIQQFEHRQGPLWSSNKSTLEGLLREAESGKTVYFYCENIAEKSRIREIFSENNWKVPQRFVFKTGLLSKGFYLPEKELIFAPHNELFGQYTVRRRSRAIRPTAPIDNFVDLKKGDYVVHVSYGIGKFQGICSLTKNGILNEYLTLEYADKITIHVPVSNIALVHKYIGSGPSRPPLSKVGTKKWENQKEKVALAIKDLASDLLELQAQREKLGGIEFEPDDNWQKEFEDTFPYQETSDQLTAIEEVKLDMQSKRPMDRLLCGDVGFGKTEIAMRAAFKAVKSGKQVAVLVPTTVLCVQHGRSFRERFADFPVTIETLNRFNTVKETAEVISAVKKGAVDILIGTHKILSDKIDFKDLGLLVIDEEQRFGVEHKERLKRARVNMDVMTMTATPIPRTLHMSLLGLRDISSLAAPPLDRRSVATSVCRYNSETIKRAILREMNRQGQVFFLHNRVRSIERMAEDLQKIVPEAKFAIAHGQMPKRQLEDAMLKFVTGKVDVLVCSTIIESGLDIPNANTMIINNADRFGLAQLHQLRGRVGRYKHKAYAYLLLPQDRPVTPIAAKRLKAIEEFSHLGAGFKIAIRDLEIRGAGNILGSEQSGHINTVGYEMYCKLLTNAVKQLKNEPVEITHETVVNLGFSTYIPKSYIPSDRQRMEIYRKIALTRTTKDLRNLEKDLKDIFGAIPQEVQLLLDLTDIRVKATKWKIQSIIIQGNDVIFSFPKGQKDVVSSASNLFARTAGKIKIPDPWTVHLELQKSYFEPTTLLAVLRKIFS